MEGKTLFLPIFFMLRFLCFILYCSLMKDSSAFHKGFPKHRDSISGSPYIWWFYLYSFISSISVRFTPATLSMAFKERYSFFNAA